MERPALLDLMAEQMLLPLGAVGGDPGTAAGVKLTQQTVTLEKGN